MTKSTYEKLENFATIDEKPLETKVKSVLETRFNKKPSRIS